MWKAIITLIVSLTFAGDGLLGSDFGGFDPDRFPIPQDNPPLQPVGFAFSIWFPIYAWLIASAVYGLIHHSRSAAWEHFRSPLIISLLIGTPWIRVARVSPFWSTIMIWAMLSFALPAFYRAPRGEVAWARAPLGLYAGWLTAAASVGTSVLLSGYGLLSQQTAAVIMLIIGLALASKTILTTGKPNSAYGLAFLWALLGVFIQSVMTSNWLMGVLVSVGALLTAGALWQAKNNAPRGPHSTSVKAPGA